MSITTPTAAPTSFFAGDTVKFLRSETDFSSSLDTMSAKIVGRSGEIDGTVSAVAPNWLITFAAADTKKLPAGDDYILALQVTDGTTAEVFTTYSAAIRVKAAAIDQAAGFDNRTQNRRTLDAINAVLEDRASKDQESYSIGGRSLSRTPISELLELQKFYAGKVSLEKRADRRRRGGSTRSQIKVRF